MQLDVYQIDAFSDRPFAGNPAGVVPLKSWLPDATLQSIAAEINQAETAFFVPEGDHYRIRWFTPTTEVKLCGHATLASAHVLHANGNEIREANEHADAGQPLAGGRSKAAAL